VLKSLGPKGSKTQLSPTSPAASPKLRNRGRQLLQSLSAAASFSKSEGPAEVAKTTKSTVKGKHRSEDLILPFDLSADIAQIPDFTSGRTRGSSLDAIFHRSSPMAEVRPKAHSDMDIVLERRSEPYPESVSSKAVTMPVTFESPRHVQVMTQLAGLKDPVVIDKLLYNSFMEDSWEIRRIRCQMRDYGDQIALLNQRQQAIEERLNTQRVIPVSSPAQETVNSVASHGMELRKRDPNAQLSEFNSKLDSEVAQSGHPEMLEDGFMPMQRIPEKTSVVTSAEVDSDDPNFRTIVSFEGQELVV
jgi:hypothetical protein